MITAFSGIQACLLRQWESSDESPCQEQYDIASEGCEQVNLTALVRSVVERPICVTTSAGKRLTDCKVSRVLL